VLMPRALEMSARVAFSASLTCTASYVGWPSAVVVSPLGVMAQEVQEIAREAVTVPVPFITPTSLPHKTRHHSSRANPTTTLQLGLPEGTMGVHSGRVLTLKNVSMLSSGSPNHFTYRSWNFCEPNNWVNARSTTRRKSASFRSSATR
jgi:hypothetical protein